MSKFDALARVIGRTGLVTSPVKAVSRGWTTYEGGEAYRRDAKSELFLLAVTNLVGEDTFYESAADRDERFRALVAAVTAEDPEWVARLVPWLRRTAHMRSAALVMAAEYVRAGGPAGRRVVDSALDRADEPAEMLAYWTIRYGRNVPQPVKRGVADAARRLYTESAALKYDGQSRAWRMADVLDVAHVKPVDTAQSELFRWLLDRRHERPDVTVGASLDTVARWSQLQSVPVGERRARLDPGALRAAGMTWESVSGCLGGPMDAAAWEALIPSMGYMALLRNLRNFDEAGVADDVAAAVADRLASREAVARSRQLPFRFYSAHRATSSARWVGALERALGHATANVPSFPGRTLVLVDTSASMTAAYSKRGSIAPVDAAALFGLSLAARGNDVELFGFANGVFRHPVPRGGSVLREMERFSRRVGEVGHGTEIGSAVSSTYAGHDRVVVLTDMQTFAERGIARHVTRAVPESVPVYGFNLAGYGTTVLDAGGRNRHEIGGLADATFRMLSLIESGESADWPF